MWGGGQPNLTSPHPDYTLAHALKVFVFVIVFVIVFVFVFVIALDLQDGWKGMWGGGHPNVTSHHAQITP